MSKDFQILSVDRLPIRLGQFLKLANLVQDGIESKIKIQNGEITVNGYKEIRRGRQLIAGDQIIVDGITWIVRSVNSTADKK